MSCQGVCEVVGCQVWLGRLKLKGAMIDGVDSQAAFSSVARVTMAAATARTVAASGQLGPVARHQTPQSDIPSSQGVHRLEPFEESLTGRRSPKTPRGESAKSWGAGRFGGLCRPA
jgi:hypothetical protein